MTAARFNQPGSRRPHWTFHAHVVNYDSGKQWIEVVGGKFGMSLNHAFPIDEVVPRPEVRQRKRRQVA